MADQDFTTSPENFKPIPDFPGYEISDQGRVRSYRKFSGAVATTPQRILKSKLDHYGYPVVSLCKESKVFYKKVHRLILLAFIGPPPPGQDCRHLDGIPAHCFLENLSWGTKRENQLDRAKHGTKANNGLRGISHPCSRLTETQVLRIRELYAQGGYSLQSLGKLFGIGASQTCRIVNREAWTHLP